MLIYWRSNVLSWERSVRNEANTMQLNLSDLGHHCHSHFNRHLVYLALYWRQWPAMSHADIDSYQAQGLVALLSSSVETEHSVPVNINLLVLFSLAISSSAKLFCYSFMVTWLFHIIYIQHASIACTVWSQNSVVNIFNPIFRLDRNRARSLDLCVLNFLQFLWKKRRSNTRIWLVKYSGWF